MSASETGKKRKAEEETAATPPKKKKKREENCSKCKKRITFEVDECPRYLRATSTTKCYTCFKADCFCSICCSDGTREGVDVRLDAILDSISPWPHLDVSEVKVSTPRAWMTAQVESIVSNGAKAQNRKEIRNWFKYRHRIMKEALDCMDWLGELSDDDDDED